MLSLLASLLVILGAVALGVISPGPSFVLVARTAIAVSRRAGLAAALGMGVGGVVFAGLALLGLQAVLGSVSGLHAGLQAAGGLYLAYLGWRIWRGASQPLVMAQAPEESGHPAGLWRAFMLGLVTQLSNPKTAVVYGSIFAALLPADPPVWLIAALLPLLFTLQTGWYVAVALVLSLPRPRTAYLRSKTRIDRLAGAVLGVLGARLVWEAARRS
jgi:threonine/homoserine/homoserine lactone efflux protein